MAGTTSASEQLEQEQLINQLQLENTRLRSELLEELQSREQELAKLEQFDQLQRQLHEANALAVQQQTVINTLNEQLVEAFHKSEALQAETKRLKTQNAADARRQDKINTAVRAQALEIELLHTREELDIARRRLDATQIERSVQQSNLAVPDELKLALTRVKAAERRSMEIETEKNTQLQHAHEALRAAEAKLVSVGRVEAQVEQLQLLLREAGGNDKLAEMAEELERVNAKLAAAQGDREVAIAEAAIKQRVTENELERTTAELVELQGQVVHIQADSGRMMANLRAELDTARQHAAQQAQSRAAAGQQQLKQVEEWAREQATANTAQLEAMEREIRDAQRKLADAEQGISAAETYKAKANTLQSELKHMQDELCVAQAARVEEALQMSMQYQELSVKLDATTAELQQSKKQWQQVSDELKGVNEAKSREHEAHEMQAQAVEAELKEAKCALQEAEAATNRLEAERTAQVQALQAELERTANELQSVRSKLNSGESEYAAQVQVLESELQRTKDMLRAIQREKAKVEAEHAEQIHADKAQAESRARQEAEGEVQLQLITTELQHTKAELWKAQENRMAEAAQKSLQIQLLRSKAQPSQQQDLAEMGKTSDRGQQQITALIAELPKVEPAAAECAEQPKLQDSGKEAQVLRLQVEHAKEQLKAMQQAKLQAEVQSAQQVTSMELKMQTMETELQQARNTCKEHADAAERLIEVEGVMAKTRQALSAAREARAKEDTETRERTEMLELQVEASKQQLQQMTEAKVLVEENANEQQQQLKAQLQASKSNRHQLLTVQQTLAQLQLHSDELAQKNQQLQAQLQAKCDQLAQAESSQITSEAATATELQTVKSELQLAKDQLKAVLGPDRFQNVEAELTKNAAAINGSPAAQQLDGALENDATIKSMEAQMKHIKEQLRAAQRARLQEEAARIGQVKELEKLLIQAGGHGSEQELKLLQQKLSASQVAYQQAVEAMAVQQSANLSALEQRRVEQQQHNSQVAELEHQLAVVKAQCDQLASTPTQAVQSGTHTLEVQQLEAELQQTRLELRAVQQQTAVAPTVQVEALEAELQRTNDALQAAQGDQITVEAERDERVQALGDGVKFVVQSETEIENLELEIKQLKSECAKTKWELESSQLGKSHNDEVRAALEAQLQSTRDQLSALQQTNQQCPNAELSNGELAKELDRLERKMKKGIKQCNLVRMKADECRDAAHAAQASRAMTVTSTAPSVVEESEAEKKIPKAVRVNAQLESRRLLVENLKDLEEIKRQTSRIETEESSNIPSDISLGSHQDVSEDEMWSAVVDAASNKKQRVTTAFVKLKDQYGQSKHV